jgi:hypothetical protein
VHLETDRTQNHNPCVGGSNPSSATNKSSTKLRWLLVLAPIQWSRD